MYYYDQFNGAAQAQGSNAPGTAAHYAAELQNMDPAQRAAQIQHLRELAAANGEHLNGEEFDSEDDALFFDNNDLANRIWEDNELG